ncbi:MFS transporter [Marivibrio halodurans]|uniref:MFS transporter n=1 Tax=Marivibrio halodurans TaxID=2039722 RepID=A0A8J7S5F5_9PROT|nr:MFS transporter [Marivibrio halodurans]MBP5858853.1 MFS transporter [Marivibrio halodurans]
MQAEQANRLARTLNLRLMGLTVLLLAATLGGVGLYALSLFDDALAPAIDRKATTIARLGGDVIERGLTHGIPLARMTGVEEFLAKQAEGHPEVLYLSVEGPDGRVLHTHGTPPEEPPETTGETPMEGGAGRPFTRTIRGDAVDHATPLIAPGDEGNRVVGVLHVGVDRAFVRKELQDILFDIGVVIFAALLITFEFLLYLVTTTLSGPIREASRLIARLSEGDFTARVGRVGRDEIGRTLGALNDVVDAVNSRYEALRNRATGRAPAARLAETYRFAADHGAERIDADRIAAIRTPLFLFIFAESLSLSFFPLYVDSLLGPVPWLGREVAIGLPIAIFMMIWAFSQPIAGAFSEGRGRRPAFLIGAAIAILGFALTAFAGDYYQLLAFRSLTAFGYGAAYIACQGYVGDNTTAENRTQGFNVFVVGFFAATICGTAVGAILADRLGYRTTFLIAAILAGMAFLFVWRLLDERPAANRAASRFTLADIRAVFANPRFLGLTLFAAIPAKFLLAAYLYFLAPLHLDALGNSQSAIGRILMIYAILMVFLSPWTARLSDRVGRPLVFVTAGTALSGLALCATLIVPGTPGVLAGVLVMGIGHAISVSTLATMVPLVAREECARLGRGTVIGIYRLVERFGSVFGPFAAGALLAAGGFALSTVAIGAGIAACALLLLLTFRLSPMREKFE